MSHCIGKIIGLVIGIALLLTGILIMLRLTPSAPAESLNDISDVSSAAREAGWILGVWNGQLAVFAPGAPEPCELYDVSVASLPEEEQLRLKSGVIAQSRRELESLLEDYTS